MGLLWDYMVCIYPLVIKHGNMAMENPRTEWRFLARNIIGFYGPFSSKPCLMTPEGMGVSPRAEWLIWGWVKTS